MTDILFHDDVFVELIEKKGNDDSILRTARVSTLGESTPQFDRDARANALINKWMDDNRGKDVTAEQVEAWIAAASARDKGLINMLMRDRHGSPFEHPSITVYVKAPIFVFREWQRHRIASYNEQSGRYSELLPEFYVPRADRPLRQVGKPGAYTYEPGTEEQQFRVSAEVRDQSKSAWRGYQNMLDAGVAKEVARIVLPLNVYSKMYTTINLRSLMNFLSLRTKVQENSVYPSFPQDEISLGADKLEAIFAENYPWVYEAWQNNGRVAP